MSTKYEKFESILLYETDENILKALAKFSKKDYLKIPIIFDLIAEKKN